MTRPHVAGMVEDCWNHLLGGVLRPVGWRPLVLPHPGYGGRDFVRVLARVVLAPPRAAPGEATADRESRHLQRRGWRTFLTAEALGTEVVVRVAGPEGVREHRTRADRSGNVDARLENPGLAPGWAEASLQVDGRDPVPAPVRIVSAEETFGIVSDLDDTVIRTYLPRPMIAAYHALIATEGARRPVRGMADLFREVLLDHPGGPVFYVSTGAWNAAPMLRRFLERHGFPAGPLLLTDWGPTNTGWFRSGADHKRACLRTLAEDFPRIRWLLVGDDGQRDPQLYAEFAHEHPDLVRAIALRQLPADEQVLAHGTATGRDREGLVTAVPEVRGPDGRALATALRGLL